MDDLPATPRNRARRLIGRIENLSIRAQIFGIVLAVAIPLTGMVAALGLLEARTALDRSSAASQMLAEEVAAKIGASLGLGEARLRTIAERPLVAALDPERCDPGLRDLLTVMPEYANVVVFDPTGLVICTVVPRPDGQPVRTTGQWFKRLLETRSFLVGEPVVGGITGRWVSILAYPVLGPSGEVEGAVGLPIDLIRYLAVEARGSLGEGATVTVLDSNGTIVARNRDPEQWVGRHGSGTEVVDAVLRSGSGTVVARGLDGVERAYGFVPVEVAGWYVYAGVPTSTIYAPVATRFAVTLGLALAGVVVLLLIALRLARRVTRPIGSLAATATAVAAGAATARAPEGGPREVAETARAFNAMLDAREAATALSEGLLASMAEGFVAFDREFRYTYANGRAGELLGRSADELIGHGYYDLFPEAVGSPFERAYARAMTERVPIVIEDYFAPWDRWFENRISPTPEGIAILFTEITERKREEAVRDLLAGLITSVADAVIAADADFRAVYWSREAETMFGWSEAEAIGRPVRELVGSSRSDEAENDFRQAIITTGSWRGELVDHRRDGTPFDVEALVSARRAPDGAFIGTVGINRDISERKRAERRAALLAALLDNASDAIVGVGLDGRIVVWNRGAERTYGWTSEEAIDQSADLLRTEQSPDERAALYRALAAGETWRGQVIQHHRDGHRLVIDGVAESATDPDGRTLYFSINRDITRSVQREATLEFQADLLRSVDESVVATDEREIIVYWGPGAERLYGWTADQAIGHDINELLATTFPGDDLLTIEAAVRTVGFWRGDLVRHHRDGTAMTVELAVGARRHEAGTHIGSIGVGRNVTELRRSEAKTRLHADLLAGVGDAVVATDADLNVIYWGPGAVGLYGWTAEEAVGRPVRDLVRSEVTEGERAANLKLLRSEGWWRSDLAQLRRDGSQVDVDVSISARAGPDGEFLGLIAISRDITVRRRQQAIIAEQARLLASVNEAVIGTDAEFNITHWGRGAEATYGWTEAEAIGRPLGDLLGSEQSPEDRAQLREQVRATGTWRGEIVHHRRDGTPVEMEVIVSATRGPQGEFLGSVGVNRDVTDRKRTERALASRQARLGFIHELERAIIDAAETHDIAAAAARVARAATGADFAAVGRYDATESDFVVMAVDGDSLVLRPGARLGPRAATVAALSAGEMVVVDDLPTIGLSNPAAAALADEGWRSVLHAPSRHEGRIIGSIALLWRSDRPSLGEVEDTLAELATTMGLGLRQVELRLAEQAALASARRTQRHLEAVHAVEAAVISGIELEAFCEAALRAVELMTGADLVGISRFDEQTEEGVVLAVSGESRVFALGSRTRSPAERLAEYRAGIVLGVSDLAAIAQQSPFAGALLAEGWAASATVPMRIDGRFVGLLGLLWKTTQETSDEDRRGLEAIGTSIAVGLRHIELRDAEWSARSGLERVVRRLDLLHQVGEAAVQAETVEGLGARVMPIVRGALGADRVAIFAYEGPLLEGGPVSARLVAIDTSVATDYVLNSVISVSEVDPRLRAGEVVVLDDLAVDASRYPSFAGMASVGFRSAAVVPLLNGPALIGFLSLAWMAPAGFDRGEEPAIRELARLVALALLKTQLIQDTARRSAALEAVHAVSGRLQLLREPAELAAEAIDILEQLVGHEWGVILLIEPGTDRLVPFAMSRMAGELPEDMARDRANIESIAPRVGTGITGWVAEHGETVRTGDAPSDPRYVALRPNLRSELCVPIRQGERVIGVVNVESEVPDRYGPDDQLVLETVAGQVAIALQNTRLLEDLRGTVASLEASTARLGAIGAVTEVAIGDRPLDELLAHLVGVVRDALRSDMATIALLEPGADDLVVRASVGAKVRSTAPIRIPMGSGFVGRIAAERVPIVVPDTAAFEFVGATLPRLFKSLAGVPLVVGDRLVGVLHVGSRTPRPYDPDDVQLLEIIGERAAGAIERVRLAEDLARHSNELETRVTERTRELSEVNAELDAFSATVAHDLRAPLRAMHGFADALQEDEGERLSAEGRRFTGRIVDASRRMERLIEDLLAYSRLARSRLRLTDVNLEGAVAEAVEQLGAQIAEADARIEIVRPLGSVRAHNATLVQVLANLLGNALKFVPAGQRPEVRIRTERAGRRRRLWVDDNGIGIAAEYHERIFRPFERLVGREAYPGSGVGLAIVRKGIERMGGTSGVESKPGSGSRFWIELDEPGRSG